MLGYIFEHITRSACLDRLKKVLGICVDGHKNYASSLTLLLNGTTCCQTIKLRHAYIDQGEVWLQATAKRKGLAAICCLANQLQSVLLGEHGTHASSGKLMVICDDYSCTFTLSPEQWFIAHDICPPHHTNLRSKI